MTHTNQTTHIWYGYRQQRIWRAWAFTAWGVFILLSWLSFVVIGLRWYVITGVLVLCAMLAYAFGWRDLFSRSPALIMDADGLKIIGYRHQVLRQFAWENITGLVSRDDTPVVLTVLHGEKRYTRLLLLPTSPRNPKRIPPNPTTKTRAQQTPIYPRYRAYLANQ